MLRMYDIIQKKKQGEVLTDEEIRFFIQGYTEGSIPEEQAAALCMAVCFRGMTGRETAVLTDAMMRSGDLVDLSRFGTFSVDKHSTGGVGDKTTLIVAPLVACLGGKVAKMSGRGLGHTGGTVDKLESIRGYRTSVSPSEFEEIADRVGVCVVGQSGVLAPADKKLYALRDVTATVDCVPLIASSVMSKKLASGAHNIVLDVKCGSGAFMKTLPEARALADAMVSVGTACGRKVRALVTNMDVPLGQCIGNALEVKEAVRVLTGKQTGDLYELCMALASNMLSLCRELPLAKAEKLCEEAIADGRAFAKMKEWVAAQGGDVCMVENTDLLPQAAHQKTVRAPCDGYLARIDTEGIGSAACMLGAGRTRKEDTIDLASGIELFATVGDYVRAGQKIAVLHTNASETLGFAEEKLLSCLSFSGKTVEKQDLIFQVFR